MKNLYLSIEKVIRTIVIVFSLPILMVKTFPKVIKQGKETGKVDVLIIASEFLDNKYRYYFIGVMNLSIVIWLLFF